MARSLYKWLCLLLVLAIVAYTVWLIIGGSAASPPFNIASLNLNRSELIKIGIFAWLLFPPAAMFVDLVIFCRKYDLVEIELVKYTHESMRIMWLAVVIAYAAVFGYSAVFSGWS